MSEEKRLKFIWRCLCTVGRPFLKHKFAFHYEKNNLSCPSLIIANHVTSWDPMLLAITFPKNHLHFVASDHIFRWGKISKIIEWLVAPVARRKGASGSHTAMECMRLLREGRSVCIFGEGEVTWDGRSQAIAPGTGSLAKSAGAALITYRFDGGALTRPRWSSSIRKGKMTGKVIRVYTPDELAHMSTEEIGVAINRDLYTDAFEEQKKNPIAFRGKNLAEHIEASLFLCPKCKKIGNLKSEGNYLRCSCGLELEYTPQCSFSPEKPFTNYQEWDDWQHQALQKNEFQHDDVLFSDDDVLWFEIKDGEKPLQDRVKLWIDRDGIFHCGDQSVSMHRISNMAMVQANKLFFSVGPQYFELKSDQQVVNFRKYLAAWKIFKDERMDENGLFRR